MAKAVAILPSVRGSPPRSPKKTASLTHIGQPNSTSKTLNRSKTGIDGRPIPPKPLQRDCSRGTLPLAKNENEAISQVLNFVSKRFITHPGVNTKDSRHLKKERERANTNDSQSDYITINVSGVTFKTKVDTLSRYPNTLLGLSWCYYFTVCSCYCTICNSCFAVIVFATLL